MNLSIKNIFLLIGLLCVAQLHAMTPEDRQAREERVKGLLGKFKSNQEKVEAGQQSENSSVLTNHIGGKHDDNHECNNKKCKSEEEKEKRSQAGLKKEEVDESSEEAVMIKPADPNQFCGLARLPGEILLMVADNLDFLSYNSCKDSCKYLDELLNDKQAIEKCLISELKQRGVKNIARRLSAYFPECMRTSDIKTSTLQGHDNTVRQVIELPNKKLASCSNDETIKVWDQNAGECLYTLQGHTGLVASVIELQNGKLASCSNDRTIKIWDSNTGQCLHTLQEHTNVVNSVIELQSGNFASCSDDGTIKIWDKDTNQCLYTLQGVIRWFMPAIELQNGKLASFSNDRTIKIWDPNTGQCLHTLQGHAGFATSVIELQNGKLASCSSDRTIKIWNPNTGQCLYTLRGHTNVVNSVIELQDGSLASSSLDGTTKIWSYEDEVGLKCLYTLKGSTACGVQSLIELKNGMLASCSGEVVQIWNPHTGECLSTLEGHASEIRSVIELQDDNLATCSADRTIKIWNLYPDDLSAQQIYLVLRLSKYADHNEKIKLDAFWSEIYSSLPDYLKERYGRAIIS